MDKKFRQKEPVRHISRDLKEATFHGYSKSGKKIGVKHNYIRPYGVAYKVDYFDPKNIVNLEVDHG